MQNALQLSMPGDGPFTLNHSSMSRISTLSDINPKMTLNSLPRLVTSLGNLHPAPASRSTPGNPPLTFDAVATAICTYRIVLLNFESSGPEEKETNGRALDRSVQALQRIFDNYNRLSEASRQLVGVFLKELHFESSKEKASAGRPRAPGNRSPAICNVGPSRLKDEE